MQFESNLSSEGNRRFHHLVKAVTGAYPSLNWKVVLFFFILDIIPVNVFRSCTNKNAKLQLHLKEYLYQNKELYTRQILYIFWLNWFDQL